MKFLVFALCICFAASAQIPDFRRQQVFGQAVAEVKVPVVKAVEPKYVAPVVVKNVDSDVQATVLRADTEVNADSFAYAFETSNGIAASSTGSLKKVDNVDTLAVQGQYQYISPEGVPVQFTYVADEAGYQPKSDLLPVPPPVPVAILRSLEYIAAHPPKVENFKN